MGECQLDGRMFGGFAGGLVPSMGSNGSFNRRQLGHQPAGLGKTDVTDLHD